jgi:hypothetical protein
MRVMALAGDAAGASWWVEFLFSPLAMSAQVGAVREGVHKGGVCSCYDPACQLDQPMTPEGEAGVQGWG